MTDETVLAFCADCGVSIDTDAPYVHGGDGAFLHKDCSDGPTCLVEGCDSPPRRGRGWPDICERHATRYPPSLIKAACDPYDYALRIVTGEVVYFYACTLHEDWVHIEALDGDLRRSLHAEIKEADLSIKAERGLDIRLEHIVWCADAPFGS
jgi:hypothetical protein